MNIEGLLHTFFNAEVFWRYLPDVARGVVITVEIAIYVVVTGLAIGAALATLRTWRSPVAGWMIRIYVDLFRAFPPLVLILLIYFGGPYIQLTMSAKFVVWIVLSLILGAFSEEIFWAGITSIGKGQWEAASATGLPHHIVVFYVILPQAIRLAVPPLTNRTIAITKHTALGAVIGMPEILNAAQAAMSRSSNATPLIMGAAAYLLVFLPVVLVGRWLEKNFQWRRM